jgi:hypothetical protein
VTDVLRGRGRPSGKDPGDTGAEHRESGADDLAGHTSSPVAASIAAFGVALTGLAVLTAVVLVAWVTDTRGTASAGAAVRLAADAWLLAHGGVLSIPGGSVDAVPLGLTVLPALLLYRAGGALAGGPAGRDLGSAARSVGGLAALYGAIAAVVAHAAGTPTARVGPLSAAAGAAVLALAAAGTGLVRAAGLTGSLSAVLPRPVPVVARAAVFAVLGLLAAGAAVAAIALAVHAGRAMELTRALDPGVVGGVLLLVVGLLLVPNGAVWAAAYATGPGFAVGAGTGVSPFGVTLGPVPALPMLAALPQSDAPPQALRVLVLVPLLVGALAGLAVARAVPVAGYGDAESGAAGSGAASGAAGSGAASGAAGSRPAGSGRARQCAGYGAAVGLLTGAALALLAVLAGGSVGGGYLTAVGPSPWQFGLATAIEVGVPAALVAALIPAPRPPSDEFVRE